MHRLQAGTTREFYWVNSGVTPSEIYFNLIDGAESVVNSASMVSSGNGHYYYNQTLPTSAGFWIGMIHATINTKPYIKKIAFRTILNEVD